MQAGRAPYGVVGSRMRGLIGAGVGSRAAVRVFGGFGSGGGEYAGECGAVERMPQPVAQITHWLVELPVEPVHLGVQPAI